MGFISSIRAPRAPPHPSKHHVLTCSLKVPCAPPRLFRHHALPCSIEAPCAPLVHPGTMCSPVPSRHQKVPLPRTTVRSLPATRGLWTPSTCPPNPGRVGLSRHICWCSGKQSPSPCPQMVVSHLHQCNGPKPGGSGMCHISLMFLIITVSLACWTGLRPTHGCPV